MTHQHPHEQANSPHRPHDPAAAVGRAVVHHGAGAHSPDTGIGTPTDGPHNVDMDGLLTRMWEHNGPDRAVQLLQEVGGYTLRLAAGSTVRDGDATIGPLNHPINVLFTMNEMPGTGTRAFTTTVTSQGKPLSAHLRVVHPDELGDERPPLSLLSPAGRQARMEELNAAIDQDPYAHLEQAKQPARRGNGVISRVRRAIGR